MDGVRELKEFVLSTCLDDDHDNYKREVQLSWKLSSEDVPQGCISGARSNRVIEKLRLLNKESENVPRYEFRILADIKIREESIYHDKRCALCKARQDQRPNLFDSIVLPAILYARET